MISISTYLSVTSMILSFMTEKYSIMFVYHIFYSFIHWWAPGLCPWLGYCEQCCKNIDVQLSLLLSAILLYAQEW
jgi:hypothetical protein